MEYMGRMFLYRWVWGGVVYCLSGLIFLIFFYTEHAFGNEVLRFGRGVNWRDGWGVLSLLLI